MNTTTPLIRMAAISTAAFALAGCGTFDRFSSEEGSVAGAGAGALVGAVASGGLILPVLAATGGAVAGAHLAEPDPSGSMGSGGTASMQGTEPVGLFEALDDDRNGSLDAVELEDSANVDRNAMRFDADRDGRISRTEFMTNYPTTGSGR